MLPVLEIFSPPSLGAVVLVLLIVIAIEAFIGSLAALGGLATGHATGYVGFLAPRDRASLDSETYRAHCGKAVLLGALFAPVLAFLRVFSPYLLVIAVCLVCSLGFTYLRGIPTDSIESRADEVTDRAPWQALSLVAYFGTYWVVTVTLHSLGLGTWFV